MRFNNELIQRSYGEFVDSNQIERSYSCDPDNNKGTHYVMWSGGTDSTLLLYELLDAYGSENVVAVSYKYPWLLNSKYESEKMHREAFKAKMNLRGEKYRGFKHIEFDIKKEDINGTYTNVNGGAGGLPQAVAWMLSISLYAPYHSYIYDGGIRYDDLTCIIGSYHKMFEGISEVLDKRFILRQPYLLFSKRQILERLFKYDLYEETWYCEMPDSTNKTCLKCQPCKTHIAALNEIALFCEDELIRLRAESILHRMIKKDGNGNNDDCKCEDKCISLSD